jgi:hypothetical protein
MDITRKGRLLGAVVVAGLLLAGCGGGEPAATDATGAAKGGAGPDSDQALEYSKCMRENGVPKFPDPQNGRLVLKGGPGTGIDPESAQFKAAEEACKKLAPSGPGGGTGPTKERQDAMLAFAKCMRANGLPDWPDPEFEGGGVKMTLPKGLSPESPQVKQAQEACADKLPGDAPGADGSAP